MDGGIGDGGLIERVIKRAAVAGGLEYWARKEPAAARGLEKCARQHRAVYQAALDEICAEGGLAHAVSPSLRLLGGG